MSGMLPVRALAADGQPSLLLPLVAALAFGAGAANVSHARQHHAPLWFVPSGMHIPDLYAVDCDRDPARFAEPIDNDRMVSIDLLPRARRGWMPYVAYDDESPQILGRGSTVIRLTVEYDF